MNRLAPRARPRWLAATVGAGLALLAADARALCTITCSCAVSTTNVVFGTISPLSAGNTDTVGGIGVTCGGTAGLLIPFQVAITKGSGSSYASRSMAYGSYTLSYNLYEDSARSMIFGDGTSGTVEASGSIQLTVLGAGPTVTIPVYGRVFGGQATTVPGTYSDAISVTLTYY